ncbi:MAG: dynamin [Cyanothece sp. SIO2G6]|nr:dynamin [Cyanothece sp. SIO2G6]
MNTDYTELMDALQAAAGVLDPGLDPQCRITQRQIRLMSDRLNSGSFRVTVFAPFNYGKSTLLNALLGNRTLPIDLIPTTGAAIRLIHGESIHTTIHLKNGDTVAESGTDILRQFAVLNQDRRMREDVESVTVVSPHYLLRQGMEFVDLPGTDDQEEQDALVRDYLLTADLVVQVLDGRKLMTLMEREQLRDWLLDRGIDQVVFVVNFLNLLEPDDQQEVTRRLRFVAESFRANLPPTVSNLYRVDALPALRARLKGDGATVQTTGLPAFESALQVLVQQQKEQVLDHRLPRLLAIAPQVQQALQSQMHVLESVVKRAETERDRQKLAIRQKAQSLIQQGFDTSVADARHWLSPTVLLAKYRTDATNALQTLDFDAWLNKTLKPDWEHHRQIVMDWVHKACDFFDCPRPVAINLQWPTSPNTALPELAPTSEPSSSRLGDVAETLTKGTVPTLVAGGLGFLLGGPVGAALFGGTSYILEKQGDPADPEMSKAQATPWTPTQVEAWCAIAIENYLRQLSTAGLAALDHYITTANPIIHFPLPEDVPTATQESAQIHQLALIRSCGDRLDTALNTLQPRSK